MKGHSRASSPVVTIPLTLVLSVLTIAVLAHGQQLTSIVLKEDAKIVLHNPDMGWVIYENYPLDQEPHGSSTLLALPEATFPDVDQVALMFSWADIEKDEDRFDFSKVNFAYDYWRKRGKEIQLRLSAESLLWWSNRVPPSGHGIPDYVLARIPDEQKQVRHESGLPYTVVDARNAFYQVRLGKFLDAVNANFAATSRPVTLVDLRGFGLWGEWHSGYRYANPQEHHAALCSVLDIWSRSLPNHFLSLSYSYDPDSPKEYFAGPRDKLDPSFTSTYNDFLYFSAFDHALTKPNITFRRDGCGGAVHSNERLLCENAFASISRGPFMSEFLGGYGQVKKAGEKWVRWMVDDALNLHPNYVCVLGWQGADARDFMEKEPELIAHGLRTMGYRLMPLKLSYPKEFKGGEAILIKSSWANRAEGRALRDFHLELHLCDNAGNVIAATDAGALPTSKWIKGTEYTAQQEATFPDVPVGEYELRILMRDTSTKRVIHLPIETVNSDGSYTVGLVTIVR